MQKDLYVLQIKITNQYDSFTSNLVKNISDSTSSSHHEIPKTKNNSYWWSSSICVDHCIGERERDRDKKNGELQYLASYGNYFSILNILANQNQVRKLIPF